MKFEKMLEPASIGRMKLRNRIVMPAMATNYFSPDGSATRQAIAFYLDRAKGGVGLIITSSASPVRQMKLAGQMGIWDFRHIPALSDLTDAVHLAGAKIAVQLEHPGRQNLGYVDGVQPVAPSAIPSPLMQALGGIAPRELTIKEIEEIEDAFVMAAFRSKLAGFDAVEVHCAHGYLLSEFLSPNTNKRTDYYGGDIDGRLRIVKEIIEKIKAKVGPEFPIICRINGSDYVPDGLSLEDSKRISKKLEETGINAISVSAGTYESVEWIIQPMYFPRGVLLELAASIKKEVGIPVIAAGRFNDPSLAEKALVEGKADFIAMGRALLADPELPIKLIRGREEDVRKCNGCMEGCLERVLGFSTARCALNPEMGREEELRLKPTQKTKKVLVAGGGPAGMEAARVAAMRGHVVTLCEKGVRLGGQMLIASIPPFKFELKDTVEWFSRQVEKCGVQIKLRTEVTKSLVQTIGPDVVIVATGASPIIPDVPGINGKNLATAQDALQGKARLGRQIIVVGGGLIGCETALFLAEGDKTRAVTLIEALPDIALNVDYVTKKVLTKRLMDADVKVLTDAKLEEVTSDGVVVTGPNSKRISIMAENILLAVGSKPNTELSTSLTEIECEVYLVGDCVEPRKIFHAVHEASFVARQI